MCFTFCRFLVFLSVLGYCCCLITLYFQTTTTHARVYSLPANQSEHIYQSGSTTSSRGSTERTTSPSPTHGGKNGFSTQRNHEKISGTTTTTTTTTPTTTSHKTTTSTTNVPSLKAQRNACVKSKCKTCKKCKVCPRPRNEIQHDPFHACNGLMKRLTGDSRVTTELTKYLKKIGYFWDFCTEFSTLSHRRFIHQLMRKRKKKMTCPERNCPEMNCPEMNCPEPEQCSCKCEICRLDIHSCGPVCMNYNWPHMNIEH